MEQGKRESKDILELLLELVHGRTLLIWHLLIYLHEFKSGSARGLENLHTYVILAK